MKNKLLLLALFASFGSVVNIWCSGPKKLLCIIDEDAELTSTGPNNAWEEIKRFREENSTLTES
jgi:hypothetical protein